MNQLQIATQDDNELSLVKNTITQGWPRTIKEVPNELQAYWTFQKELMVADGIVKFQKELMVEDGLVLKGTRIVIPKN